MIALLSSPRVTLTQIRVTPHFYPPSSLGLSIKRAYGSIFFGGIHTKIPSVPDSRRPCICNSGSETATYTTYPSAYSPFSSWRFFLVISRLKQTRHAYSLLSKPLIDTERGGASPFLSLRGARGDTHTYTGFPTRGYTTEPRSSDINVTYPLVASAFTALILTFSSVSDL